MTLASGAFEPGSHPGAVEGRDGWNLKVSPRLRDTEPPTEEELRVLREKWTPRGFFIEASLPYEGCSKRPSTPRRRGCKQPSCSHSEDIFSTTRFARGTEVTEVSFFLTCRRHVPSRLCGRGRPASQERLALSASGQRQYWEKERGRSYLPVYLPQMKKHIHSVRSPCLCGESTS